MQTIEKISPSQINTYSLCRRRWAYVYLDKVRPEPSKAAVLGNRVHKTLENYLTGHLIDNETLEGRIARAGLHYLPNRLPKENVERPILFLNTGIIFHGYIDFFDQIDSQTWLIGDHKTCSSFDTALSPDELKKNIQASIYAQWAFQEMSAQTVKLKWIYYRTKGSPQARCVEAEIKSDEQPQLFWPQLQIASDIKTIVEKKPDSRELSKNLHACFKFGRCPFYGPCRANQKPTAQVIEMRRLAVNENHSAETKVATKKSEDSFHLFIDCTPIKACSPYQRTIELSDLLKPVLKKIQHEKNLSHYRLAGYGQHVGIMAHYLEDYLNSNDFDSRTAILSSSKTPEGIDTLQTLSAAASHVIRGF